MKCQALHRVAELSPSAGERVPGAGAPPVAKVTRKEARHTQRRDRASGVPLEIPEHLPPKPESAYFPLCALTYTSDFTGRCPPQPLSEKRVNLQLQLIKFLGVTRVFQPTNSFGSPLNSVQFSCSVVSDSLRPHESQHARPLCPSPAAGVHSDSRP